MENEYNGEIEEDIVEEDIVQENIDIPDNIDDTMVVDVNESIYIDSSQFDLLIHHIYLNTIILGSLLLSILLYFFLHNLGERRKV